MHVRKRACVCVCARVRACERVSLSELDANEKSSIKFPAIHYLHIKVDGFHCQGKMFSIFISVPLRVSYKIYHTMYSNCIVTIIMNKLII